MYAIFRVVDKRLVSGKLTIPGKILQEEYVS